MLAFATARRAEIAEKTISTGCMDNDLFSRLVMASEKEGKNGLTDEELVRIHPLRCPN